MFDKVLNTPLLQSHVYVMNASYRTSWYYFKVMQSVVKKEWLASASNFGLDIVQNAIFPINIFPLYFLKTRFNQATPFKIFFRNSLESKYLLFLNFRKLWVCRIQIRDKNQENQVEPSPLPSEMHALGVLISTSFMRYFYIVL